MHRMTFSDQKMTLFRTIVEEEIGNLKMIGDLEQGQETKDVTGLLNLSKNYLGQKKVILKKFKF